MATISMQKAKKNFFSRSFEQTNGLKMLLVKNTTIEQERGLDEGKKLHLFVYAVGGKTKVCECVF